MTVVGTVAQVNNLLGNNGTTNMSYTPDTDAPPSSAILHVAVSGNDAGGQPVTVGLDGTIQIAR